MGQQQLLLLVLATVIVGLATVAGIQAFEQGQTRANQDALTQQAVKIASDVQAKVKEPSQFGGYDGDLSSSSVSLDALGYQTSSATSGTYGGSASDVYKSGSGECGIETTGNPTKIQCHSGQASVTVRVGGLEPDSIKTVAQNIKS